MDKRNSESVVGYLQRKTAKFNRVLTMGGTFPNRLVGHSLNLHLAQSFGKTHNCDIYRMDIYSKKTLFTEVERQ